MSARSWLGVVGKDLPRYIPALWGGDEKYLALCNRNEVLRAAPDSSGYRCEGPWTSQLHAPTVIPRLGSRLMSLALRDHPVCFRDEPADNGGPPQVSFIIGHRGEDRLPHLLLTLQTIAGQEDVSIECIVVEQDVVARLQGRLPVWVRHLHTPSPSKDMPFCRSWAFNVGARHAGGDLLVLHDNDLLVSADYAARSLTRMRAGFDVINLKRFVFYLDEAHTRDVISGGRPIDAHPPESIMQNARGGGSIAIAREAYLGIGGMDEGFVGWGGEDDEFWERAQTLRVWPYGCLPLVHLWHPAQPGKYQPQNPTLRRYRALSTTDATTRISALRSISFGNLSGPAGWTGAVARQREGSLPLAETLGPSGGASR